MMLSASQSLGDHNLDTYVYVKDRLRGDHLGTRTVLASCPCPETLQENEVKSGGLINLVDKCQCNPIFR